MDDEQLIDRINDGVDPEQLVDLLGFTTEDLTARLRHEILECRDVFDFLDTEGEEDER